MIRKLHYLSIYLYGVHVHVTGFRLSTRESDAYAKENVWKIFEAELD